MATRKSTGRAGAFSMEKRVAALKTWRDGYNPKRNLDVEDAIRLCENYSRGRFSELMWLFGAPYMGIEQTNPTYMTILLRRRAALKRMENDVRIHKKWAKDAQALEQKACLDEAYERIDNLKEAIAHLQLANFRGFAHLAVMPRELMVVHQWNVARDGSRGAWRYNPEARDVAFESLDASMDMTAEEYIIHQVELPVGRIALLNDLANSLADKDWNAFIDIYGIPAWLLIGPPNLADDKRAAFEEAAEKIAEGGSGYLPHGSEAKCADSPRGINPFESRMRYLNEMLVMAGTGGLLTMLSMSGSGTLAGNAHQEAFDSLAAGDAADVTEVLNRQYDRRVLLANRLLKPGENAKAGFVLDAKQETDVGAAVDQIQKLGSIGYVVKPEQVTEITGYEVTYVPPAQATGLGGVPMMNSSRATQILPQRIEADAGADMAAAIAKDLAPVAARLDEILEDEGGDLKAAAARLLAELPELAKKAAQDPAAAALIEKAMRQAAGLEGATA